MKKAADSKPGANLDIGDATWQGGSFSYHLHGENTPKNQGALEKN